MTIKLEGEGMTLMAWPLVEELFCGFPKRIRTNMNIKPSGRNDYYQFLLR